MADAINDDSECTEAVAEQFYNTDHDDVHDDLSEQQDGVGSYTESLPDSIDGESLSNGDLVQGSSNEGSEDDASNIATDADLPVVSIMHIFAGELFGWSCAYPGSVKGVSITPIAHGRMNMAT